MDHRAATLTGARERYFLGELSAPEREEFEEHYFGCPECAEAVRDTARFVEAARPLLAPPASAPASRTPSSRPTRWRVSHPAAVAAGLALVSLAGAAAYQGLVVIPSLRSDLQQAEALRAVPFQPLTVSRGEPPSIVVSKGDRFVLLALSQSSDRPHAVYRCQLQDATGRTLRSEIIRPAAVGEELQVLLPVATLPAGAYVLAVEGLPGAAASSSAGVVSTARYAFTLEWRSR